MLDLYRMKLIQLLSKGQSKDTVRQLVSYVGTDSKRFAELVSLFLAGPIRTTQHASWALSYCVENCPKHLSPYYRPLLAAANEPTAHDAVKRNIMRLLQFVTIPTRYQGQVAELCFRLLANKKEAVAIRVFSMTVLANLAKQHPALCDEVRALIEDGLSHAKPAYLSRAKKTLKQLATYSK